MTTVSPHAARTDTGRTEAGRTEAGRTRALGSIVDRISAEQVAALTEDLIRSAGENPGDTEEASAYSLSTALKAIGASVQFDYVADGRPNLIATLGGDGTGTGGVLFLGHSDVVPAGEGWSGDPFEPREVAGCIIGRGAVDMKGGLAAVVMAMAAVNAVAPEVPLTLLCTVDEEHGATGALHYLQTLPSDGSAIARYTACVAAEPTDMLTITGCRGASNMQVDIAGVSAHAGNPDDGASAILAAADVMRLIEDDDGRLRQDPHPLLGRASWNIGTVEGGHGSSIVADRCSLTLDRRTLPGENPEEILNQLLTVANYTTETRQRPNHHRLMITGEVNMVMPGFITSRESDFVTTCQAAVKAAGGSGELGVWTAACEGGFIALAHQIPTVVLGPGDINNQAHRPDERVYISDLLLASKAYAAIAYNSFHSEA